MEQPTGEEKISKVFRKRGEMPLSYKIDCLQRFVNCFEDMENGILPVSTETKKAIQTAIKEICIALSQDIDK